LIRAKPLSAVSRGEIFSATRIKTFRECPAAYYLRYVLGFPSEGTGTAREGDDEMRDREFPAEIRGRVFHAVMQSIDRVAAGGGRIEDEVGKALTVETSVDAPHAGSVIAEIAATVRAVLATPFWKEVAAGTEMRTEYTISCTLGDDFLSGTMDRVYRDESGAWHILDYKTDRVDATTVAQRADAYWPQLKFYALLLQKFFATPSVTATLWFTSRVEHPVTRVFAVSDLELFESEIRALVGRIKAGDFSPARVPCDACPFQPEGCRFLLHS
jgi:RecB family exonuclease